MKSPSEQIGGLPVHPAAKVLPLMPEARLTELAADIKANGQRHPIITCRGEVIDGRNRLLACQIAGVKPRFAQWDEGSPTAYVRSANYNRRDLTPSQRAMAAVEFAELLKREGKTGSAADRRRVKRGRSSEIAAKEFGAKPRTVERAIALKKASPELAKEVLAGKRSLDQADRQLKRAAQVKQVKEYVPPVGEYAVIISDPPWKFDDTLEGMGRACPYPPMELEEIIAKAIPPAAADCILFLWTTNAHLIDGSAKRCLDAWCFTPKALLTWGKDEIGLGRYVRNCTEQCVIAVKGKPIVNLEGIPSAECCSLLFAPVGEHSEKPAKFYEMVERICPSPARLEMFARAPREGWVTSGAELQDRQPDRQIQQLSNAQAADLKEKSDRPGIGSPETKKRTRLLIVDTAAERPDPTA